MSAAALADRLDLAAIAVERLRTPVVIADARRPGFPIALANPAFLDLTGYAAEEILGRNCRFMQGPKTSQDAVRRLREGLAREETVDVELLNYRRDGTTFWNAVHLSPVHDEQGRLAYYFGSQWDVSERREAEALRSAQQRLLLEVDHRTLNALALVQGFVRLSRRDTAEQFAQTVQERVDVLARTHALLSRSLWADVTLRRILQDELGARADHAVLEGPQVLIAAERVQAVALLVHELTSNAANHGALAHPGGRVEVSWTPTALPGLVDIVWRERGGRAATPGASGLGLRLISSIVRQQLQGRVSQTWGGEGLTTEVRCRISGAPSAP